MTCIHDPSIRVRLFGAASVLVGAGLIIASGCTTDQQTAIESAIANNSATIQTVCTDVLAVANNPLTDAAALASVAVSDAQKAVKAGCGTAEGIASMAQSASTVDWLGTVRTVMQSGGTVLPPPVAPVPLK